MKVSKIFKRIKNFICNKKSHAKIEPENKLTRDIITPSKKKNETI